MKRAVSITLATLGLVASACATEPASRPDAVAQRTADSRYTIPVSDGVREDTIVRITRLCRAVQQDAALPIECQVGQYKGYPTMLVSFVDSDALETYLEAVVDKLAVPFCQALAGSQARLVLMVSDEQVATGYACDTRQFSEWVRVGA